MLSCVKHACDYASCALRVANKIEICCLTKGVIASHTFRESWLLPFLLPLHAMSIASSRASSCMQKGALPITLPCRTVAGICYGKRKKDDQTPRPPVSGGGGACKRLGSMQLERNTTPKKTRIMAAAPGISFGEDSGVRTSSNNTSECGRHVKITEFRDIPGYTEQAVIDSPVFAGLSADVKQLNTTLKDLAGLAGRCTSEYELGQLVAGDADMCSVLSELRAHPPNNWPISDIAQLLLTMVFTPGTSYYRRRAQVFQMLTGYRYGWWGQHRPHFDQL